MNYEKLSPITLDGTLPDKSTAHLNNWISENLPNGIIEHLRLLNGSDIAIFADRVNRSNYSFNIDQFLLDEYRNAFDTIVFLDQEFERLYIGVKAGLAYILLSRNKDLSCLILVELSNTIVNTLNNRLLPIPTKTLSKHINSDNTFGELIGDVHAYIEAVHKISLDDKSNLSFRIDVTKPNSYMNKYNDIHTLLVTNFNNKNYEAMKTQLARMYALIYIIERDVMFTNKVVPVAIKSDATKARMFAKNDLSRYLKEINKVDKKFDLYKFYSDSKVKDMVEKEFDIKISLSGLKHLLRTLF